MCYNCREAIRKGVVTNHYSISCTDINNKYSACYYGSDGLSNNWCPHHKQRTHYIWQRNSGNEEKFLSYLLCR